MASLMMLMALEDLKLLLQVVTCVLAGWYFEKLLSPFHFLSGAEVHEKTVEENKMSVESDSDNEVDSAGYKEVFTPQEDIPHGLQLLEQYGIFGASPGAWTSRVAHKATLRNSDSEADSAGCKEVFTPQEDIPHGLQLLEQYGVFGASPGAWTNRVADKECQELRIHHLKARLGTNTILRI